MRHSLTPAILLPFVVLILNGTAFSHGAWIEWSVESGEVAIRAVFDDGTPMTGASVTVYPENSPNEPWLIGETDSLGTYRFTPDASVSPAWDLQVRKAGHGDMVRIDLTGEGSSSTALSIGQIILMTVCVTWGLIGTGLYFAARKRERDARS
jgi:nickel transport protein